ncbi:MAG TPA: ATP-binding protein [Gemmatimonadaceae bacterium]|nr:ATP-binding protein [Gemmatimonadaceae bacterium]
MSASRSPETREPGLAAALIGHFARLTWGTLALYTALVIAGVAIVSELLLRRSLSRSAGVIHSLLGMYADPGGARTTVAPEMLAEQLVGMGGRFVITRTTANADGMPAVYYLSPGMPARRIEPPGAAAGGDVREAIAHDLRMQGWRFHVLHQRAGEFDLFLAESRVPYVLALAALGGAAVVLLPVAGALSRRAARQLVSRAIAPLERVRGETLAVSPADLSRRVTAPTGIAEVSDIATTINRLLERVERAHAALAAFTADASHELRTPLTHIRAQVQWALDDRRPVAEVREALAAVGAEVERTERMIDDLLLLARGENRELVVARQPFALSPLVDEVAEITQVMTGNGGVLVTRSGDHGLSALGDAALSRQILLNLASNAVRHGGSGTVGFRLVRNGERVGVAITDSGQGIAPEHLPRLFDRFYRVEASRSREHGGAGLGLAIAKMLAELQDAAIAVESAPGQGSTFTLWLPAADAR